MSNNRQEFTTPAGRLVQGSLYKANTTDAEGKPLVVKSGPNAGQPRQDFFFALAIQKGTEQHWSQTAWGAKFLAVAQQSFPRGQWQHPSFAWKVKDGDSAVPDKKGRAPNSREGYPGHWILSFSSGYPPKIYQLDASLNPVLFPQPDAVNLGDWVEVCGTVDGNGSDNQPGIFLNHGMVCFRGYGQRIVVGPDASSAGFGASPLPAGVSTTPLPTAAGSFPAPAPALPPHGFPGAAPQGFPGASAPQGFPAPAPAPAPQGFPQPPAPGVTSLAPPPTPTAVQPHPGFLTPQSAAPTHQMTALAQGHTYESLISQGWTDALLRERGLML